MSASYRFRLGSDPMDGVTAGAARQRIEKLCADYASHVTRGGVLNPAKVHVWAVSLGSGNTYAFAPVKVLGYADNVKAYLADRRSGKEMTGVDAVTALRKRGFIDCAPADFPTVDRKLAKWISSMNGQTRSFYRFLIHPVDIKVLNKRLASVCAAFDGLGSLEKKAFLTLVASDDI